ncbi:MAG TPA: Gfo/Idh/MocA family oxidoreductase [Thermoanaerobaculia bacterium]|nr:Gfo/Idh/MocA family oxidoreductase [Thermoanaerobaculia bacterium]
MNGGPLSFGLVGAGAIAQAYAQAFRRLAAGRVAGVADVRPAAARALAEELGCAAFASHEEMAERLDLDAVLVCTPPATHAEICLHWLGRGRSVLCEKPLALDAAVARRLHAAAEEAGAVLTMASKFRYVEDVRRAKSIVASGILGEIVLFENAFTARVDMAKRWNAQPRVSGGGVLIDNGTHSVDLVRYFLGPVAEVNAVEGKNVQGLPVEDTVRLFMRSHDGVMASIDLSWSLNKELPSYLDIYGSHGTVRVGWKESRYRQAGSSDWVVFGSGYDKVEALRAQLDNFCAAVAGREPLLIQAEDAIASVEVIEAAYASLRDSHWRPVEHGEGAAAVAAAAGVAPAAHAAHVATTADVAGVAHAADIAAVPGGGAAGLEASVSADLAAGARLPA